MKVFVIKTENANVKKDFMVKIVSFLIPLIKKLKKKDVKIIAQNTEFVLIINYAFVMLDSMVWLVNIR